MYYDLTECGKRIAQLRAESRLTQLQAAEKLNISVQHYRSMEAGRRGASIELLVEMANTFHTSLDYIIFGRSAEKYLGELKAELQGVIAALKAIEKAL